MVVVVAVVVVVVVDGGGVGVGVGVGVVVVGVVVVVVDVPTIQRCLLSSIPEEFTIPLKNTTGQRLGSHTNCQQRHYSGGALEVGAASLTSTPWYRREGVVGMDAAPPRPV